MLFAALHESVPGTSRPFVATHSFGRYWRHSGHSVKPCCPSERRECPEADLRRAKIPQRSKALTDPCRSIMLAPGLRAADAIWPTQTARVHHAARRRGGLAFHGARTAAGQVPDDWL